MARRRHFWRKTAPFIILGALLLVSRGWDRWAGPGLPVSGDKISGAFPLCDAPGYSANCTVDGDTFRIGSRRIRVEGIDAPEREGKCAQETALAQDAARALSRWLGRGPFTMLPQAEVSYDQYGRELQTVWRIRADGSRADMAADMIESGHARVYRSSARPDWCR